MKILNFMSGWLTRSRIQVKSFLRYGLIMTLMMILQPSAYAEQTLQALDAEFLEFLSLYDSVDEDLVDHLIDDEAANNESSRKKTKQVEEVN